MANEYKFVVDKEVVATRPYDQGVDLTKDASLAAREAAEVLLTLPSTTAAVRMIAESVLRKGNVGTNHVVRTKYVLHNADDPTTLELYFHTSRSEKSFTVTSETVFHAISGSACVVMLRDVGTSLSRFPVAEGSSEDELMRRFASYTLFPRPDTTSHGTVSGDNWYLPGDLDSAELVFAKEMVSLAMAALSDLNLQGRTATIDGWSKSDFMNWIWSFVFHLRDSGTIGYVRDNLPMIMALGNRHNANGLSLILLSYVVMARWMDIHKLISDVTPDDWWKAVLWVYHLGSKTKVLPDSVFTLRKVAVAVQEVRTLLDTMWIPSWEVGTSVYEFLRGDTNLVAARILASTRTDEQLRTDFGLTDPTFLWTEETPSMAYGTISTKGFADTYTRHGKKLSNGLDDGTLARTLRERLKVTRPGARLVFPAK